MDIAQIVTKDILWIPDLDNAKYSSKILIAWISIPIMIVLNVYKDIS